jgi:hypothetical protein
MCIADSGDCSLPVEKTHQPNLEQEEPRSQVTITDSVIKMWTIKDLVNKATPSDKELQNFDPNNCWILDSGCSNHLTCNRKFFIRYTQLEKGKRVIETATGQRVNANGIGDTLLNIYNPTRRPMKL